MKKLRKRALAKSLGVIYRKDSSLNCYEVSDKKSDWSTSIVLYELPVDPERAIKYIKLVSECAYGENSK